MTRRRSNQRRPPAQQNKRGLLHETLEKRELLAADINAGPQLTGIEPSDGVQPRVEAPWNLSALNELDYSPREVLLQFSGDENLDAASLASGIRFIGSGGDGTFDDGNEFEMVPHQLQFADDNLTVLAKFIETFSDDRYRLLIVGHDPVTGARGLQDIGGDSFCEAPGDHEQVIEFDVEFESQETALDRYIAKPDSSYTYTKVAELSGPGYTTHIIDMTSQTWRSPAEVNDPVWNHWVQIVVPTSVQSDTAILTIGGGSNLAPQPTTTDPFALQLALASGQITISLPNIPNQPLFFTDDPGTAYFEDALLAYSYDKFLDGGDEEWPVILPMTKAAVRAMDTAQDFLGGIGQSVQDFVVTGGSKRGWTTWLTAAVDDRVSAIAPLVFDVLNMEVSIENHRENYLGVTENIIGGYARAIQDYTRFEVFDRFGTDPGVQLGSIIDPFQYRDRFTMPKYLLNGTGDQFFTPDSSLFYFDDLPGEKYLRYVPNTDHSLNQDAVMGGLAWINTIEAGTEIPDFSWTFEGQQNNTIRLQAEGSPTEVNLWRATNPDSLDFRLETAAPTYTSTPLTDQGGGQYVGTVPLPASGGTAYFLELKYEINGQELVFTTQAQIVEPLSGSGTATQNAPLLLSASAGGEFLSVDGLDQLDFAPTELTFRFTGSRGLDPATLGGIQVIPAGGDGVFDGDEQPLTPGFLDFGDSDQIVIARFTDPLPDDRYQIVISGQTDPATGAPALSSIDGVPFSTADGASTQRIEFDVELGSQVVAVVPQPITGTGASRVQHREQIHVYFSGDLLDGTAEDPRFYQLYFTADTIEPGDDGAVILPDSVEYQADLNRAVLTFSGDLAGLAPDGSGTFRLRVGSAQARPGTLPEHLDDLPADVPDTFDSASYIGDLFGVDDNSITVRGEIQHVTANPARWPGLDSPGIRDNRRDVQVVGQADTRDGINVFYYNFASLYGEASGDNLESSITPAQRQRAREALDLYAEHLGVQFIETDERGLQIVTGNLRGLVETADTGAGGVLSEYRVNDEDPTRGVLVLDASENWYDGYGLSPDPENRPSWFVEALRGIGSLLGIGDTFEQVPGVASGSNPALYNPALFPEDDLSTPTDFSIEPDFLSTSDIIPGQALHRPEIKDADLYRFTISEPGRLTIETFAERKLETSLLDTDLKLWRQDPATGEYQLVARNDDFYGNDSFLGIAVMPDPGDVRANYIVGITAKGNDTYNPDIAGSGGGGRSQGFYDMRITFQRSEADAITDVDGSAIDGDADGVAGGEFDFWFRAAPTKDTAAAGQPRSLFVNSRDGVDSPASGTLSSPYKTIQYALAQAEASGTGDILRLLPDGGADGRIATTDDNRPYLIASGVAGNDGALIEVPQGVTLMIDAGAILKLQNAKISVGSEAIDEDRSLAALQVLGAPQILDHDGVVIDGTVHLTSLREERRDGVLFGIDVLPGQPTPTSGDWGGIEFRNDFDYSEGRPVWESEGIFLDYVSHADIRYGGGSITPLDPAVTPLQLHQSRPTLIHNQISEAREAAISADPDSFQRADFPTSIARPNRHRVYQRLRAGGSPHSR